MTTPVFYGFETKELTFYKDKNVAVGKAVGAGALKKATVPAADEKFCGICSAVNDTYVSVIMKGHAVVKYTGVSPVIGYNKLAADGNGNVKVSDSGREILVLDVDTANRTIEILL